MRAHWVLVLLVLPACHVKVPSVADERELVARGTFPRGIPAWISRKAVQESGLALASSGLVPEMFIAPAKLTDEGTPLARLREEEIRLRVQRVRERQEVAAVSEESRSAASPLDRIVKRCPGIESDLRQTIVSTETADRVRQFEQLTRRCPDSPDLLVWLGKDYMATEQFALARRSFEQALTFDRENSEAKQLIDEIGRRLQQQREQNSL